ncbi:MAG: hypothetical protein D4R44_06135 [Actinobacteria bacterium]|nr:MAG: hypothetical protein D4R44_06135 [Actinomycetota bacterium]
MGVLSALVLSNVFSDAIDSLRHAFAEVFLERQPFDEHLQTDMLLGDLVWNTSYAPPHNVDPPQVIAHVMFNCPSWSQTTYRMWYVPSTDDNFPMIQIEVIFRVQHLAQQPHQDLLGHLTPPYSPVFGVSVLERKDILIQLVHSTPQKPINYSINVTYGGDYMLTEQTLVGESSDVLDAHFRTLGEWVASTLIKLGKLDLEFVGAGS